MGLDIVAYKNLSVVDNPKFDEDGDLVNWQTQYKPGSSMEWSEEYFPGRGEGIDPQKVYTWEEKFDFRAGSYSGYNWWRDRLNEFMGKEAFQELIDFPDNEGVIGPVVSKKLHKDFADNSEKAKKYSESLGANGAWWFELYQKWERAFGLAAENGAVDFG